MELGWYRNAWKARQMVTDEEIKIMQSCVPIHELVNLKYKKDIVFPSGEFYNFNLSILPEKDNLVAWRCANFPPQTIVNGKVSYVAKGKLDETLSEIKKINFRGYGIRLMNEYNSMEDPKLFVWKSNTWCLFVRPNRNITKIIMILLNLDTQESIILPDPKGRPFTKNWMPLVQDDKLFFVTDVFPTDVYELINEELIQVEVKNKTTKPFIVHGGSNILKFNNRNIGLVHGRFEYELKKWFYWHAVASWDDEWNIKLGRPFIFERAGVEFSLCLTKDGSDFLIPYSVNDDGVSIIGISEEEFRKLV
jgi:hypothetical protein